MLYITMILVKLKPYNFFHVSKKINIHLLLNSCLNKKDGCFNDNDHYRRYMDEMMMMMIMTMKTFTQTSLFLIRCVVKFVKGYLVAALQCSVLFFQPF